MTTYREHINQLTHHYNDAIRALEHAYHMETSHTSSILGGPLLKRQYSQRYDSVAQEYLRKRHELTASYKASHPSWAKARRMWGWVFVIGVVMALMCCTMSLSSEEASPVSPAVTQKSSETFWSADNIPIPFLQDSTQYVSNPDHVLTQSSVDRMNAKLRLLDTQIGVQSVFIVVNHIYNDDPFRMAQDVGNKYGVGHGDRGLIVVVGYQDHSINISPGRSLEADLTDAECHRLEQRYVVPAMRAEMPDSAMIYLTAALYSTLQKKQLPVMSDLSSSDNELDDAMATTIGLTFLFLIVWGVFFLRLNRKYEWLATVGAISLLANPFIETTSSGVHIGIGGFRGGSDGGFSGGSFGGGSFGGGGATSRW